MTPKIHCARFLVASLVVVMGILVRTDEDAKARPEAQAKIYTNAMDVINTQNDEIIAMSCLLYELAAERFSANTNKNRKWVLTSHQGRKIRTYTDGNYTVISLPIIESKDEAALCNYCTQYNSFSARAADLKVEAGDYREAKELYQLLLHFDRCGGKEDFEKRLMYLERLEKKEDVKANLTKFMQLSIPLGLTVDFSEIEKIQQTVVTNLLEIRLP